MAVSNEYLEYVLDQLSCVGEVAHKRMFGGIGLYFDGLFFGLIDDDTLFFKVDDDTRPRYQTAGCAGFDPYKDGRPSIGYFSVPIEVLEDQDELGVWARESIAVARRKTAKKTTGKRSAKTPAKKSAASTKRPKKR